MQHGVAFPIAEGHVLEDDLAPEALGDPSRVGRRDDRGLGVEQLENPLGRCHRRLHRRVALGQLLERPKEFSGVVDEGHQGPEGHRADQDAPPAGPHDRGQRDRADELRNGREHRIESHPLQL